MWEFHQYLENKLNITWLLGDTNFIFSCWKYLSLVHFAHSWEILSALKDKICIPARPFNILCFIQQPEILVNALMKSFKQSYFGVAFVLT